MLAGATSYPIPVKMDRSFVFDIDIYIKPEGNSFFSPERGGDVIFRNFRLFCNLKSPSQLQSCLMMAKAV